MTRTRAILFSLTPLVIVLLILEVVGRYVYPFGIEARGRMLAKGDPRLEAPFENASGEIILADIFGMEKRYLSFLGFLGSPNSKKTTFAVNQLGFRDSPVTPRQPKEYRILLLGGSAAWGWGASSNKYTVSGALEAMLNENGRGISYRVMSGAYLAWTSLQERIALMEFFDRFDPDLVISLSGFNDIVSVQYGDSRELLRMEFHMIEEAVRNNLTPMNTLTAIRKVGGTLGIWRLVVLGRERMRRGKDPGRVDYDPDRAKYGMPKVVERYLSMSNYSRRRGAQFVLALQPEIYTSEKKLTQEEELVWQWRLEKNSRNFKQTWDKYRSDLVQHAKRVADEGFTVVDLESVFDGIQEPVFVDDSHFNDSGYIEIAKALKERVMLKRSMGPSSASLEMNRD